MATMTALKKNCLSPDLCEGEVEVDVSRDDRRTERRGSCGRCGAISRFESTYLHGLGGWQLEELGLVPEELSAEDALESEDELPFGVDRPEALMEPFCACGRVLSRCDGTRRGCGKRAD